MADKIISEAARLIRAGYPVSPDQAITFLLAAGELLLRVPEEDLPGVLQQSLGFLDLDLKIFANRRVNPDELKVWTLFHRVKKERDLRAKQDRREKRQELIKTIFADFPAFLSNFKVDLGFYFDPSVDYSLVDINGRSFGECAKKEVASLPDSIIQFLNLLDAGVMWTTSGHRRRFTSITIFRDSKDGDNYKIDYQNVEIEEWTCPGCSALFPTEEAAEKHCKEDEEEDEDRQWDCPNPVCDASWPSHEAAEICCSEEDTEDPF